MKAHTTPILAVLVLTFGACSSPTNPTAPQRAGQIDAVAPRYGVMYGSGNRSEEGQGGAEQNTQTVMAADSAETTATVAGGVMYGSGN